MKTINVQEAQSLAEKEGLPLVDVRTKGEYDTVHAKGAISHALDQVSADSVKGADYAKDKQHGVLILCKSGGRARKAAPHFEAAGFGEVYVVEGGTDAWVAANFPHEKGQSTVISLERQVRIGAGAVVFIGTALGYLVNPTFYGIPAFVGAGLFVAGVTDFCGMGILLAKCPWNK